MKPAFEDLEDDLKFEGFGNEDPKQKTINLKKRNENEEDNGLFVDNDFGDDFEEEEEEDKEEEQQEKEGN